MTSEWTEWTEHNETPQERLVRATLREHAPTNVDVERGWATVAARLDMNVAAGTTATASATWRARRGKPMRWQRVTLVAAAAMAIALILAGAGVGAAYWGGLFGSDKGKLIGDERLYTTINQSQTVGDVTVTIDKVYADPGDTYIGLTIRLPQSSARQYSNAILNHFDVTDASGQEPSGATESCEQLPHDGSGEHCLIDIGPFQPGPGVTQLTLTVEIGEVWLLRPSVHDPDVRTGPWHFTFTLPFHQQNLGPGGPYLQPASTKTP